MNVEIVATPAAQAFSSCISPASPQYTQPLPADGGPFSFSTSIALGQQYQLCGYVMQAQDEAGRYLGTFPVATTQLTVTAPAGACDAGTTPALNLQAPRWV